MSKAYDKAMAGIEDAQGYLGGKRDGFAVHDIEVPEPDVAAIPRQDGTLATGFCQEHRRTAGHAQELGAGPPAAGRVGARASCVDRKAPVDHSGRTRSLEDRDTGFQRLGVRVVGGFVGRTAVLCRDHDAAPCFCRSRYDGGKEE